MRIRLNGEDREIGEGLSIAALLDVLGLRTQGVAVELNKELVSRSQRSETTLVQGDEVEVVTLVGGG